MPRKTSALFVACAENVVLSLVVYTLLSGLMELVAAADFAPAMRASIFSQVVLVMVASVTIAVLSAGDRARVILSNNKDAAEDALGDERKEEVNSDDHDNAPLFKWISDRRAHAMSMLSVANAYSTCIFAIALLYLGCFLQAASGWGLDDGDGVGMHLETRVSTARNSTYASSQRLDWVQATVGGSGWVFHPYTYSPKGNTSGNTTLMGSQEDYSGYNNYSVNSSALPLFGSLYAGAVLAYLVVCTLLGLYISLSATPEGDGSYLILEPRGLVVANGIITFGSTGTIEGNFARCRSDAAGTSTLFAIFCLLACWGDELPFLLKAAFEGLSKAKAKRDKNAASKKKEGVEPDDDNDGDDKAKYNNAQAVDSSKSQKLAVVMKVLQGLLLTIMCWVPLVAMYAVPQTNGSNVPGVIVTISSILGVVSNVMGILDVAVYSSGGSLTTSLLKAYALVQGRNRGSNGGESTGDADEKDEDTSNNKRTDDDQVTLPANELSLKGFPGAGPTPDADNNSGGEQPLPTAPGSGTAGIDAMYRMVGTRDIWSAAGVTSAAAADSWQPNNRHGGARGADFVQRYKSPARTTKEDDKGGGGGRKWHVA